MRITGIIWIFLAGLSDGCIPGTEPIEYGVDKCSFCTMTIVDQRFGSELVTQKGKIFKFDAVECLVNYLKPENVRREDVAILVTNTHDKPGILIPVENCYFLQSENLPSPMGMYINPFSDSIKAIEKQKLNPGTIWKFNELSEIISQKLPK